ncbi:aa3-type cytochrome c oxidase subunit IV [Rhizobium lentis]|uniref:Aa3-type cytochrome c oxidase subunit IV n=1 Tax=Rhizobium lentis TaxID=1138194 RepID=A0A9Q3MAE0_9HYPH|nr:aa3-type cytochrome c oxidase subunit IV [Rhizobium lentis]MBX4957762.1 aa3-type cytochrome c oxidase subunit IV [Rhizobium lentis]MBX4975692.1 aa3-type cytochrome c oxidase subunit IV [Rhizobium lentis]MBX4987751.1 aa3-type cytochrome c oxidase subunit IV [Rhizobium lentis]MBX5000377.1 aa3-type cytochrome c oxidase subunit IV [Rhizobium lentis]MBX5006197.1 aa3-type cytochrome c oxidase subunit IV [Rhizobium lentis]
MAEHHTGPVETGAPMDYKEHEKTYDMFIAGTKYGTMLLVVLLLAMTVGFFGGAGFLGGLFIFVFLLAIAILLLR